VTDPGRFAGVFSSPHAVCWLRREALIGVAFGGLLGTGAETGPEACVEARRCREPVQG
jgi:hypothetical protein